MEIVNCSRLDVLRYLNEFFPGGRGWRLLSQNVPFRSSVLRINMHESKQRSEAILPQPLVIHSNNEANERFL